MRSGPALSSESKPARLGPASLLGLAAWCGTLAGLLEVGTVVVRKRFFDTNHLLGMSRHFIWLVPLTDLLILLLVGLGRMSGRDPPAAGRSLGGLATLCALTLLPTLLVAFPQVYGLAWLLVALGVSARLVPSWSDGANLPSRRPLQFSDSRRCRWRPSRRSPGQPIGSVMERAGAADSAGAPNVLLIVMDTVAADHLASTAMTARQARRSTNWPGAAAGSMPRSPASSWTLPSHASMFTGRWPHELSVGWRTPLDAASPTVAEFLARGGTRRRASSPIRSIARRLGAGPRLHRLSRLHLPELSPFKMAVMVQRSLDGLQAIGDVLGDALDLDWLRAGVQRIRERFETDRKEAAVVNREFLDWLAHRPSRSGRSSPS